MDGRVKPGHDEEKEREWLTISDIVALGSPALPATARGMLMLAEREGWCADAGCAGLPARARKCEGQGGGWEFHISLLPAEAQARYLARENTAPAGRSSSEAIARAEWDRYARLPQKAKDEALRRLSVIERIELLSQAMPLRAAVPLAARDAQVSASTVWAWWRAAGAGKCTQPAQAWPLAREHRLAALAPRHAGRTVTADCHPEAWEFIKADYLRQAKPAFVSCYRRLVEEVAPAQGWAPIPSAKTLRRRLEKEVPRAVRVMYRQGSEAAKRTYPHQTRDRSVFCAMQAVTADGHTLDVFVRLADGRIVRLVLIAIQDLFSGMIVGWRLDLSESWHAVRLAFADAISSYGIPEQAWLDNGRAFASKWMTGGQTSRYRFKVKAEEPEGVLTRLGIKVRWVTPYHGQAKPIERAFRDLAERIAKHPFCEGAYTGRSPQHKPENYGARAIPVEDFEHHVAEQIARHNLREGRTTATARGRSFAVTFRESYEQALVARPTQVQLRDLLLASEAVTARKPDGSVYLAQNRYWHEALGEFIGRKLFLRFDPRDLFAPVGVHTPDGRFVCEADCVERTGFDDIEKGRAHEKARNAYLRRVREVGKAEIAFATADLNRLLAAVPAPEPETPPRPAAVRLVANGGAGHAAGAAQPSLRRLRQQEAQQEDIWSGAENFGRAMRAIDGGGDVLTFRPLPNPPPQAGEGVARRATGGGNPKDEGGAA